MGMYQVYMIMITQMTPKYPVHIQIRRQCHLFGYKLLVASTQGQEGRLNVFGDVITWKSDFFLLNIWVLELSFKVKMCLFFPSWLVQTIKAYKRKILNLLLYLRQSQHQPPLLSPTPVSFPPNKDVSNNHGLIRECFCQNNFLPIM